MPKISVIMTLYNSEKTVRYAVESILNQTFGDFELVIVDDGSKDNGLDIVRSYNDPRIITKRQDNQGLAAALNVCLSMATGDYVARQDPDDFSLPDRFAYQVAYLESNPNVAMVSTDFYIVDIQGKNLGLVTSLTQSYALRWEMIFRNPFGHTTIMIRKNIITALGGYLVGAVAEDYELWTRLIAQYETATIKKPLALWLANPNGITHSKRETLTAYSQQIGQKNALNFLGHELDSQLFRGMINFWICHYEAIYNGKSYADTIAILDNIHETYKEFIKHSPIPTSSRREIQIEMYNITRKWQKWLMKHDRSTGHRINYRFIRYIALPIFWIDVFKTIRYNVTHRALAKIRRIFHLPGIPKAVNTTLHFPQIKEYPLLPIATVQLAERK